MRTYSLSLEAFYVSGNGLCACDYMSNALSCNDILRKIEKNWGVSNNFPAEIDKTPFILQFRNAPDALSRHHFILATHEFLAASAHPCPRGRRSIFMLTNNHQATDAPSHNWHNATMNTPFPPTPLWRRLGAIAYDLMLVLSLLFVASIPLTVIFRITTASPWYDLYRGGLFLLSFLYYGWFWTHGGQTLGMKTWGLRLVSMRGKMVSWPQAMLRFTAAIISWLALGAGFFWSLLRKDRATWHDLLSDSRIVFEHRAH